LCTGACQARLASSICLLEAMPCVSLLIGERGSFPATGYRLMGKLETSRENSLRSILMIHCVGHFGTWIKVVHVSA
jgi:hypothetical protein